MPRFKRVCYIVLKNINLSNYGNQYPVVTAILSSQTFYANAREFLDKLIERAGVNTMSQSTFGQPALSTSASLTTIPFSGTAISLDGGNYLSHINSFLEAWQIVKVQNPGGFFQLVKAGEFLSATTLPVLQIPTNDILGNGSDSALFTVEDSTKEQLPTTLSLSYFDLQRQLEQNSVTAFSTRDGTENQTSISLPFTMTRTSASSVAERILREAWIKKRTIKFTISTNYFDDLVIGRYFRVPRDYPIGIADSLYVVTSVTYSSQGFMEVVGQSFNPAIAVYTSAIDKSKFENTFGNFGELVDNSISAHLTDGGLLEDSTNRTSHYLSISCSTNFSGNLYFYTSKDDVTYTYRQTVQKKGIVAELVNPLPSVTDNSSMLDNDTVITVRLKDPTQTLTSVTEDQARISQRILAFRREHIGYTTATQISADTWELRGIYRGANDTEDFIGSKTAGQECSFPREAFGVAQRVNLTIDDIGDLYFKVTSQLEPVLSEIPTFFVEDFQAHVSKALPPVVFRPRRNADNTWTVTWSPRTMNRANLYLTDGVARATNTDGETYLVQIQDPDTLDVVRQAYVTGNSYTYSVAEQQVDNGGNVYTNILPRVFQQSASTNYGNGRIGRFSNWLD